MDYNESIWRRGRKDTVTAAKSFPFIILEVGGSAMTGVISENPWVALIYFFGLLLALYIGATVSAPIRQRDEERAAHKETKEKTQLASASTPQSSTPTSLKLEEYDSETRIFLIGSVIDLDRAIRESGPSEADLKGRVNDLTNKWSHLPQDHNARKLLKLYAEVCFHAIEAREHLLGRGMLGLYFCDPVTSDVFGMLREVTNQVVNALHGLEYDLLVVHRMNQNSDFELGMLDKIDFAKRERKLLEQSGAATSEDPKPQSPPKTES